MGEFPRKSDGRRVFTVEFKRGVVQQLLKGDKTLAEVSRELDIQPSVVRQWKRRFEAGAPRPSPLIKTSSRCVRCGKPTSGSANSGGCWARSKWRSRSCKRRRKS